MDINDNGKHKNKPIAHPKTAAPLYAGRYRRVVMLAIALFALIFGLAWLIDFVDSLGTHQRD